MELDFSSSLTQQLFVFAISLTSIWVIYKVKEWFSVYRKLPPGPFGYPIVGYLPYLSKDPHKVFSALTSKYGNIITVNIASSRTIVINDCELAKKILNNPATLARPPALGKLLPGSGGFAVNHGKEWTEQRRFCVSEMKDLGLGKGKWESMTHDDVSEFIDGIKSWKGRPTNFFQSLEFSQTGNNLSLLIGRKLPVDLNNPDFKMLMDFSSLLISLSQGASVAANISPLLMKLCVMLKIGGTDILEVLSRDIEMFLRREIQNNLSTDPQENPSFIQRYVQETEKQQKNNKGKHYFSVESLMGHIIALFVGGVDTTTASLQWLLMIIAAHPEVQRKVHQEIDDVAGRDRRIYFDERINMPYTMATINEMERWVSITPLLPLRWTLAPVEVGDYVIPAGSSVIANGWNIHRNPKYFEDPDAFKPERFLSSDKSRVEKLENFIPFSVGKRSCPGEQVATMTIFLYFTAIMQKFQISCPKGKSVSFEDTGSGSVRHVKPQELCFIER